MTTSSPDADDADLRRRCASISLLLLDVDGVMTDGVVHLNDYGVESRHFFVRDGVGMNLWRRAGHKAAILSGRSAPVVARRAAELRISPVLQGIQDKGAAFVKLLDDLRLTPEEVCFIGDDLVDLPVLRAVRLAACPSDAAAEVRAAAHLVTQAAGGRGAVREVIEAILHRQGRWEAAAAPYMATVEVPHRRHA